MAQVSRRQRAKQSKIQNRIRNHRKQQQTNNLAKSVLKWNDPVLSSVCDEVSPTEDIKADVEKIVAVLDASKDGVGLAAPQVGIKKRIVAIKFFRGAAVEVFVNPVIVDNGKDKRRAIEGCLSYPGVYVPVERYRKVKVEWRNLAGETESRWFFDRDAICIQHEIDHTLGICLVGDEWRKQDAQRQAELKTKEEAHLHRQFENRQRAAITV
ncbi:MAG: peptide deformylase [Candidatus Competibacteraceae bacterium]|nr:peptide deformylase [Candidatus Competibacteraceae bacterium]